MGRGPRKDDGDGGLGLSPALPTMPSRLCQGQQPPGSVQLAIAPSAFYSSYQRTSQLAVFLKSQP